jgi:hypothetical protein
MIDRRVFLLPHTRIPHDPQLPRGTQSASQHFSVCRGEYSAVALDQIDGMALRDGKLALRGSNDSRSRSAADGGRHQTWPRLVARAEATMTATEL